MIQFDFFFRYWNTPLGVTLGIFAHFCCSCHNYSHKNILWISCIIINFKANYVIRTWIYIDIIGSIYSKYYEKMNCTKPYKSFICLFFCTRFPFLHSIIWHQLQSKNEKWQYLQWRAIFQIFNEMNYFYILLWLHSEIQFLWPLFNQNRHLSNRKNNRISAWQFLEFLAKRENC